MTISRLPLIQKKYKTALFRRRIIERLRLQMVTEQQVLTELGISRTLLNQWNRTYQRYQLTWWFKPARFPRFVMKKPVVDPLQALQQKLAYTEALLQQERLKNQALQTVIEIAEKEFKIPIRKKSAGPPERFQAVSHLHLHHPLVRMQTLCGLFGMSRQAWYDEQKRQDRVDLQAGLLLAEVKRLRLDLPSIGIDVLHYKLTDFRQQHGIKIGRDKLAKLLRDNGLLIAKRSRRAKTTWSHHRYFKYPNLTIGLKVKAPNSLWVSDITYILIGRGFGYLSLITDAYSRKLVGWALDESLQATGPVAALKMALKANKGVLKERLIHHGAGRPVRSGRSILLPRLY